MSPTQQPNGHARIGPHPGHITSSNLYIPSAFIHTSLASSTPDPSREDSNRISGVQLIDTVRTKLALPVRTFATACVYYHRFRLAFKVDEYSYQDAALACLFVACKVEDTIKKSRDVLAGAYNVKNADKPAAPDDKIFDQPSKVLIGLERLILETIGFDFRTRHPFPLLVKTTRSILPPSADPLTSKHFFDTAYAMSIDLYKTFIPIKRTTFSMVCACVDLTSRLLGGPAREAVERFVEKKTREGVLSTAAVMETMLDLLDLYVQHGKMTKLGTRFDQGLFMDIKISLNKSAESLKLPRHLTPVCASCTIHPSTSDPSNPSMAIASPIASSVRAPKGQDGTMRFIFDPEAASNERRETGGYFREEWEEHEVEVDEPIPPPPSHPRGGGRDDGGRGWDDGRGGGRGGGSREDGRGGRGGRGRGRGRWEGPYGNGPFRGDHRGRGRGRGR